ncbi:hypothetical protein O8W32_01640 [Methanomassiliicoccales archaeon LGM-DZ1]|nr:hypothetical protein O8W32_01640 [Methanomassiliicoccales archaeon LGM-DZ1]
MSVYTTLGVTVSPEAGIYFLRFLKTLRDRPDRVTQDNDGTVSALWEDRNHFDEYSDCDYSTILDFLDNLGEENYISESITEDGEPEIRGGYYFGFARRITYDLYGDPVDLNTVMSGNRKRRFFGRRR